MVEPLSDARITGTPIPLDTDVDLTALATRIVCPSTGMTKQQEISSPVLLNLAMEGWGVPISLCKKNSCSFSFLPGPASELTGQVMQSCSIQLPGCVNTQIHKD